MMKYMICNEFANSDEKMKNTLSLQFTAMHDNNQRRSKLHPISRTDKKHGFR